MKIIKTKFKDLLIYDKDTYFDKGGILGSSIFKNISKLNFHLMLCLIQKKMY